MVKSLWILLWFAQVMDLAARVALRHQDQNLVERVAQKHLEAFTFTREFHLPPHLRDKPPMVPQGTDLAIWTWDEPVGPRKVPGYHVVIFAGKANKPLVGPFWYKDEHGRQSIINDAIENRKRFLASKVKKQEERKNYQHGLQEGDILYSSWGYDQTNIDFYQVTKVIGKAIEMREIGKRVVGGSQGSDKVMAEPNEFTGPPMRKIPQGQGEHVYVTLNSYSSAHEWDGRPLHQTASGYGH